jgi:hypothetical protein
VPDRHRKWQSVVETVTTLHATKVEYLDAQGQLLHVVDTGGPIGPASAPAGERDDTVTGAAALARAIVSGQQVALDAHVESTKMLVNAVLRQQELSNKRLEVLEKLLTSQMEMTHQLSAALVDQRLETAETAAAALEQQTPHPSEKIVEMGTKLLEKLG